MIAGTTESRPASRDELISPELAARLDRFDVRSRKVFPGALPGERRSKRRGRSVEFDDYRNYSPGDDLRHIDWNVYARLDRLFIKLFREEEDLALHILLDSSASMDVGKPSKLVFAHRLAMAFGYLGLISNNRVSVGTFSSRVGVVQLAPLRGRKNVTQLSEFLLKNLEEAPDGPSQSKGDDFNGALRQFAARRVGKGVVVVLSDFLIREGYTDGLGLLANTGKGGFDTTCIQIMSPGELDPSEEEGRVSGDLHLTDNETGQGAEITVSAELLESYRRGVASYCDELAHFCRSRRMKHTLVSTSAPIDELMLSTFRRIGLLASH
jgi:uncharacterized protein (DUF58 family)